MTTHQEYQIQRYEGASTIYGPNTLDAYIQIYSDLSHALANGSTLDSGPSEPDLTKSALRLLPDVGVDIPPIGKKFGDMIQDVKPNSTYTFGDQVSVRFVTGHPRNDLFQGDSFLYVQRFDNKTAKWLNVRTDGDWSTKYIWKGGSTVLVTWDIENGTPEGNYRIFLQGATKPFGKIILHNGTSSEFFITSRS